MVIGIDDVLEARIACAGSTSSAARNSASFASDVLHDRLDHQVGRRERRGLADATEHLCRGRASLRLEPLEALLDSGEAALDGARERVVEQHRPTGGGDDLGNAGTHLTGTDDEDALEGHQPGHAD